MGFTNPVKWLERINFYTGVLEVLAKQHSVSSIERIEFKGDYLQNDVCYHFISIRNKVIFFPFRMHRLIKDKQPDVILVNGLIFPLQVIQLRLWLGRKPRIILFHRADRPYKGYKRLIQRIADNFIDAYLFTSLEFANSWERNINTKKIHEVIQASSVFHAKGLRTSRGNGFTFLWVGRLNHNKDPLTLVKAFKKFSQLEPHAKLNVIFQSDELLEQVTQLATGNGAIHLIGKVEHANLQQWFESADFFISTSHSEGGGVAVCEAMSCGCIPILTNIISFRKISGPGNCGLLFEPGNEENLLHCLLKVREMDLDKERKKTIDQFNRELSFTAIAGKIENIIKTLENS